MKTNPYHNIKAQIKSWAKTLSSYGIKVDAEILATDIDTVYNTGSHKDYGNNQYLADVSSIRGRKGVRLIIRNHRGHDVYRDLITWD